MASADVDVGYIAGHLGLDQLAITSLATEPSADQVSLLLRAVAAKAHEYDELYAAKLQADIELEAAVRSSESRLQTYKATADNALKELQEMRQKLKEEETNHHSLDNQLQTLKAKNSDHVAEVKALTNQIETLQASNRTNLTIIESHNRRDESVADELSKQHQRNVELGRQLATLQQSEQTAKGQLSSAKYREESLKQQLDMAQRNAEWLENELKTKTDEGLKHRKEKGARIAELQQECEDARAQADNLRRSEQQLRERLDAMQSRADEALVKLQKQEAAFASMVESYKSEIEDQQRLVDMSSQLSQKHQSRVRELESEKERLKDNYENELRRVRLELEQERNTTSEMEEKIGKLEAELDELQLRVSQARQAGPPTQESLAQQSSAPQTPRANGSAVVNHAMSPFATPGSIRNKGVLSATQAIDQLYQVKGQLVSEKRRNQQLSEELDNVIAALEAKAPEVQELQAENDTLRNEISRMSELSQQSFEERDAARKAARKAEAALATTQTETKILKVQLRDLGTQIQMLVFNVYALEKGMDQLSDEEKYRLSQLEKGEISEEALSDMSDTHQFITQKLVVFKDVKSLREKNQELLRITRELAEQLESEETLAAKHQAMMDHEKVVQLERELQHMAEESKSAKNTMESYKMERDMFRRILQQRGTGAGGADDSLRRSSIDGSSQRPPLASIEGDQAEALNEALRKLQSEYDHFRDAQEDVRKDLRNQIETLSHDRNALQTERIKLQGEVRVESERRDMLQSNYVALQSENTELRKQSQTLLSTTAKQDLRTQQVAEELVDTKGLLDSMRNETANLKAEKKLWKEIQDRMSKDNEGLIEEKNRLNNLLATHQNLENERSLADGEARRKAQDKIDALERELSETQRKLSNEVGENKELQMRKEFETKQLQSRIDELLASLSQLREEHVGIKTTKEHLQARVDELTVELRNAEQRMERLQPRPTPRSSLAVDHSQREHELEAQVGELTSDISDVKRDLDLATTQLANAKEQAEQYRQLSQGSEEALEDLRASQDQYRQEMELLISEKDGRIRELEQRIDDVCAELSRSNSELSALRDSQAEVTRRHEDEKNIIQDELNRLREESAKHAEATRFHQQDLRAQADIATKAQEDYEQELVKHAEAARLVQQLRGEYNELKSQTASLRAEADSARMTLAQSESSWDEQRQRLEQEMADLLTRREDVNKQNKLLHEQLEGLTAQVSAMQQSHGDADNDEAMSPVPVGNALEGLRELNGYLRREKEILEVQYDLKTQESKRLHQQLQYVQGQLDETRLKLDQERVQTSQAGRGSLAHKDLMEKLNELNLYRESSAALRSENVQLKDQVTEKGKLVEELEAKIQPLEAEIGNLSTTKSYLEEEIKQVQDDRDRWQKRTESILTKYGRVDPEEMETLKKTIEELTQERDALKDGEQPLQAKVTEMEQLLETERESWANSRSRMTDQFKERSKRLTGEKNELVQRNIDLSEKVTALTEELEQAQKLTEAAVGEKTEMEQQAEGLRQETEELRQRAQPSESSAQQVQSAQVTQQLEERLANIQKELESVTAQKLGAEQQVERLRTEMQAAIVERDEAKQQLQRAEASQQQSSSSSSAEQVQQMPEPSSSSSPPSGTQVAPEGAPLSISAEEKAALEAKVAEAEAKAAEFEEKANEVETRLQQTIKERCDKMRDSLNVKLKESRAKMDEQFKQKDEEFKLRLEQEKLVWQAEKAASNPGPSDKEHNTRAKDATNAPSTPATGSTVADLSQLDDAEIRQFLSTNATVKSIIGANIKKRLEVENERTKADIEAKIAAAREQAQLMESKKSVLRLNIANNKVATATTKIGIVEKAASETPQRPVVEVWEEIKKVKGAPGAGTGAGSAPDVPETPVKSASTGTRGTAASSPAPATPVAQATPATTTNIATTTTTTAAAAPPPAAETKEASAAPQLAQATPSQLPAKPDPPTNFAPHNDQHIQAQQGAPRSGIPMLRGNAGRGRGQAARGAHDAAGNQFGRGRGRGFNPNASDFQPGMKRPRGDGDGGRGTKRARGS
ncbi:hypothetical protein CDD82_6338 [Ophiocordyceps australis]|uniref:GED domain-containing protein n=1 Tax=Ophiocordyceps australis TaxID=1399860 RepID=A0A2C5YSM6_9HYPO|nr:hypothetical protein CDD82_6338 [Ophiocordyceps australis]